MLAYQASYQFIRKINVVIMQYLVINGDHNLKIDKHLKKVLPSARSSDNTITNLSKSNLNFTVEKKMSELSISSSSEFLRTNPS